MGSRASGLASPLSDIDVNLSLGDHKRFDVRENRAEAIKILRAVTKAVAKNNRESPIAATFTVMTSLTGPKVPITKLVHIPSSQQIELQCTNSAFNGLVYAKSFQRDYPDLKSIFLLLKHTLRLRGLD